MNSSNKLQEQLTAYLDGELDAEQSRAVEEQLALDPACRKELERLERAWSVLDSLPRAAVGEGFTHTTMELVTLNATQELATIKAASPTARLRKWAIAAALLVACGTIGFAGGRAIWPDPNRRLVHDLPILENLDAYQDVQDIGFLERLDDSGLFAEEHDAS